MPKIVYRPEGAEPRTWELSPGKMLSPEAMEIEELTGWTFEQWWNNLVRGSMKATRAALWTLMKRDDPTLDPDHVVFSYEDFDILPDAEPGDGDAAEDPKADTATPTDETPT